MISRAFSISMILWLFAISVYATAPLTVSEARKFFWEMGEKKLTATGFFDKLKNYQPSDPVLMAYKGASQAASAGEISGVMNKLDAFKAGKSLIEKAISLNPKSWEIRFIRFTTQMNAPSMLGYNHKEEDRAFFLRNKPPISTADDRQFFNKALSYLINHGKFEDHEIEKLKQFKNQL